MSLTRSLLPVLVLVVATSLAPKAGAQVFDPVLPDFCDLDWDWFSPIYCDCPDDELFSNSGFFFTYDRMNLYGSRPDRDAGLLSIESLNDDFGDPEVFGQLSAMTTAESGYDGSWGNRYNFGYITDEKRGGWLFSIFNLNDPSQRLLEPNVDRNGNILEDELNDPVGPTTISLNQYELYGFELNKVWRLEPTYHGLVLEPFLGARYVRMTDYSNRSDVFIETPMFPATIPVGPAAITEFASTRVLELRTTTDNDLFGGQFGVRTAWRGGRWGLTSDVRGYAFRNYADQDTLRGLEGAIQSQTATYDAAGVLQAITVGGTTELAAERDTTIRDGQNFVYGGELRLEAALFLSKKAALRAGFDLMAFTDGLGRAQKIDDQRLVLVGYSLGFTINR